MLTWMLTSAWPVLACHCIFQQFGLQSSLWACVLCDLHLELHLAPWYILFVLTATATLPCSMAPEQESCYVQYCNTAWCITKQLRFQRNQKKLAMTVCYGACWLLWKLNLIVVGSEARPSKTRKKAHDTALLSATLNLLLGENPQMKAWQKWAIIATATPPCQIRLQDVDWALIGGQKIGNQDNSWWMTCTIIMTVSLLR